MQSKVTSYDHVKTLFADGMTILFGGFGGVGTPPGLVDCLISSGVKDIHLVGNDAGAPGVGIGKFVILERAGSLLASHIGLNPKAGELMVNGKLKVNFAPQGILAERIRSAGVGLHGFLSEVGKGTPIAEGKPVISINGKEYLYEAPVTGDIAMVYAKKADHFGNLIFDKTARNINPYIAMAAKTTIVEADEIVAAGEINPEDVMLPGIFVKHIVPSKGYNWKWSWQTQG